MSDRDLLGGWTEILPDDDDAPDPVGRRHGRGLALVAALSMFAFAVTFLMGWLM